MPTDEDEAEADDEGEDVGPVGFATLAVALAEPLDVGVELVLAQRLEHLGRRHQARKRGREGGGEATGVDQGSKHGH